MKRNKRLAAVTSGLAGGLALAATPAWAGWGDVNLPYGVTSIAHSAYDLNMFVLWICIIIGIVVFGAMGYSMYYHRKSMGHDAVQFHHSTTIEIVWTIIPLLILIVMAIVATRGLLLVYNTDNPDMEIKVTGYQWLWRYDYVGEGVSVYSKLDPQTNLARQVGSPLDPEDIPHYPLNVDNPLVVPTDTKIRFLITSEDVIHAWWVVPFGWKWDAIPGFINEGWATIEKPGVYRGQCTELCGRDHGFMPVVVVAKPPAEYQQWLAEQKKNQGAETAAAKQSPSVDDTLVQADQRGPTGAGAASGQLVVAH